MCVSPPPATPSATRLRTRAQRQKIARAPPARSTANHRTPPTPQTRYVMRYRHCDGKLILKVTDDRVCLKFQTDQQTDVKKMERLNNLFFAHMCGEDPHEPEPDEKAAPARPKSEDASEKRPASSEGAPGKKRKGKK